MKKMYVEAMTAALNTMPENAILTTEGVTVAELKNAIAIEASRNDERKAERNAQYDVVHNLVLDALDGCEMDCKSLFVIISKDEAFPKGFTDNQLNYALNHMWTDEIAFHREGKKPAVYCLKSE